MKPEDPNIPEGAPGKLIVKGRRVSGKELEVKEKKAKKVKRLPVEHFAEYAFCDCGGEMVWVIDEPETEEGKLHQCQECGKQEHYSRFYPDVITVVKFKGKKETYNCGQIKECDCEPEDPSAE